MLDKPSSLLSKLVSPLAILVVAFFLSYPFLFQDLVGMSDDFFAHYGWGMQFADAFQEGRYYPRWMPLDHHGFGSPAFFYYPPLTYQAIGLVSLICGDHWLAMKLVVLASFVATGLIGWAFGVRLGGGRWSVLLGLALMTGPMYLLVLYRYSSWSWFAGFPWMLAFLYAAVFPDRRQAGVDPRLTIAAWGLVMTHILTGFVAMICTLALGREGLRLRFRSLAFALALAAVYLYPAFMLMDVIESRAWLEGDHLDWRRNFVFPVLGSIRYGFKLDLYHWGIPAIALALGLVAAWARESSSHRLLAVWGAAMFMASELSYPLWAAFPPLEFVQFPFRFIYLAGAAGAMACFGAAVSRSSRRWAAGGALGMSSAAGLALFAYAWTSYMTPLNREASHPTVHDARPEYRPRGSGSAWREYLERGGLDGECRRAGVFCRELENTRTRRTWLIDSRKEVEVVLPLTWFPAWNTHYGHGRGGALPIDSASGLFRARSSAGGWTTSLSLVRLPSHLFGIVISSIAMIVLFWVWFRERFD